MTLSLIMVSAQSNEESKLGRTCRDSNRGRLDEKNQRRYKKRAPNKNNSSASNDNYERGCGSQFTNLIAQIVGRYIFGKFLAKTGGCFCCGSDEQNVKNCFTIAVRVREAKQTPSNCLDVCELKKIQFYNLQANKEENLDASTGKL